MSTPTRLNRSLLEVSGPEARGFLDSLLTQNLVGLDEAGVRYGALLSPQGKVIADMFIWPHDEGVMLDLDPRRAADVLRRLSMYKLRADVHIEDVSARDNVLVSNKPFDGAEPDPRLAALGWRAVEPGPAIAGDGDYDAQRLAAGVPDLAVDAEPEEVFGLEGLLEELNGVDFKKGCFVGQENVSRMKRRATTRKKFCPIAFEGAAPAFGTAVTAGAAELGTVRTGAEGRALALLRLDRALEALEQGTPLTAGGRPVKLDPPSWLIVPRPDEAGARD